MAVLTSPRTYRWGHRPRQWFQTGLLPWSKDGQMGAGAGEVPGLVSGARMPTRRAPKERRPEPEECAPFRVCLATKGWPWILGCTRLPNTDDGPCPLLACTDTLSDVYATEKIYLERSIQKHVALPVPQLVNNHGRRKRKKKKKSGRPYCRLSRVATH